KERHKHRLKVGSSVFGERFDTGGVLAVGIRILLRECPSYLIHPRVGLSHGHSGFEPGDRHQRIRSSIKIPFGVPNRHPQLTSIAPKLKIEIWRHDADYGVVLLVNLDCLPHEVRIGTVVTAPETIAQHHDSSRAGLLLFRCKASTNSRL